MNSHIIARRLTISFVLFTLLCAFAAMPCADAQSARAVRFQDLPGLAKSWPKAWSELVGNIVPAGKNFEKEVLRHLDALIATEPLTAETFPIAETILTATLRHHESTRLTDESAQGIRTDLQQRIGRLRRDWIDRLRKKNEHPEAIRLAREWLPGMSADSLLRPALLELWAEQARFAVEKEDYSGARAWLDRMEASLEDPSVSDPILKQFRTKAENMQKEAESLADAQAVRLLEQALALWPRLPGARDALDRRKGTFASLLIAVPALPEQLSPATAATYVEKQTLDLLFDRLFSLEEHSSRKSYRPMAASAAPVDHAISLRHDLYWSNGNRLTAADIRHTALLMGQAELMGRTSLWREFLEVPRPGGNAFSLHLGYRRTLLDPLAPWTFHILPQYFQGKQLTSADDSKFAKSPIGSGPFQYAGRKVEQEKIHVVFQGNPYDLRGGARSFREVRMVALTDAKNLAKPLPPLILDGPSSQLAALRMLGYKEVTFNHNSQVDFLAINHRKPALASLPLRRAIAHALDRVGMLNRHYRGGDGKVKHHRTLNGLTPRGSWATCPAPRVPDELFNSDQARLFAKQARKNLDKCELTLHYPDGDARTKAACIEIARTITDVLNSAEIKATVHATSLSPGELKRVVQMRDYELAYWSEGNLDQPHAVALLFDSHEEAKNRGGSNYLGYDGDIKLQELMRTALSHRQFMVLQASMHALHAHLNETMPLIPLWQLEPHVLVQPNLRLPALDPNAVFTHIRDWELSR